MSKFLKVFLFALLAFPFTANAVTVVSWGGAYTESQIKAYGDTYSCLLYTSPSPRDRG